MRAHSPALSTAVLERPTAPAPALRPTAAAAPPRPVRRLGVPPADPLGWLLGPALLLLVWTLGSMSGLVDARVLPAPWATASTALDLIREGRLQANLAISAWRAAQGLAFGVAAGVLVALASGLSLWGGYVFDGLVQVKRSIPTLALIPLLILWFGIGETMKVTAIAISAFIPIYLNTHAALRGIETRYVELAETLGLGRWAFVRQVVLPGALPGFLLGLRFAVMAAWLALVVVEQLNATSGIGYMINLARTYAQSDIIVVGLVVYALLGLTSDLAVRQIETRALGWRRTFGR
ncbi:ABC transporter permease [Phenylobacterium sp.]|uniref:ABC transporter permease n=1 Tax=Phenylobacterium sp. TaxID=1871053 RepID=UPI0011F4CF0F|nr:ABC transporter permease [Phenylobacterium sp.]THD58951.1 MAG: ABC transporter permease [Phenylobacterium sp.]